MFDFMNCLERVENEIWITTVLLETVCHLYPIHVFKLDRLYLETTKSLLEDSDLSHLLKIVYLVRDPRAIHASRCNIFPKNISKKIMMKIRLITNISKTAL